MMTEVDERRLTAVNWRQKNDVRKFPLTYQDPVVSMPDSGSWYNGVQYFDTIHDDLVSQMEDQDDNGDNAAAIGELCI